MASKYKSVVSSAGRYETGYLLTNGSRSIRISYIVIYDNNGPIITNYTNNNRFSFELEKSVSSKPVDYPQWDNPAGFVMRDTESDHADMIRLFHGARSYWLCIHIDNTRPYVRELSQYWSLYDVEPGTIKCTFSLEGCTFTRIVRHPAIEYARNGLRDVLAPYDDPCTVFNNSVHAMRNIEELIGACDHIKAEAINYREIVRRVRRECGIVEVINACHADGPINHCDYYDISRHEAFKNTYRIECDYDA